MKKLRFHYHMEIAFSEPVCNHVYTLKCLPRPDGTQEITECSFRISPESKLQEGLDSFGNKMIYGTAEEAQSLFSVDVEGRAVTGICRADVAVRGADPAVYRYQTPLTQSGGRVRELLGQCRGRAGAGAGQSFHGKMCSYMEVVHGSIAYGKGATDITTTAEESLALGRGVCQDFSHIFLSLCREDKIPARYVVGMLMGEGESHAWVEVYDGRRWLGFDPTNNVAVEDAHIKISHGRDYRDCSINRGVFTGLAKQKQSIFVEVSEDGDASFGKGTGAGLGNGYDGCKS